MKLKHACVIGAVLLLSGGTAGCGDNGSDLPPPASPSPTQPEPPPPADLTPEEQQAVDEVQSAIDEFVTAFQDALVEGVPTIGDLPHQGGGPILDETYNQVVGNYENNRRADGWIEWSFLEAVQVDLENVTDQDDNELPTPLVVLRYCADATGWQIVDKDTGQPTDPGPEPVTPSPGSRHTATFSVHYFDQLSGDDPQWWIQEWVNEEDRPC